MKPNSQSTQYWRIKLKKNELKKDLKKWHELTCDPGHKTEITS